MLETQLEPPTAIRWDGRQEEAVRSRKRQANQYMRDALRLLDPDELIPFFCECEDTECFATVWLTSRDFDRARARPAQDLRAHEEALLAAAGI